MKKYSYIGMFLSMLVISYQYCASTIPATPPAMPKAPVPVASVPQPSATNNNGAVPLIKPMQQQPAIAAPQQRDIDTDIPELLDEEDDAEEQVRIEMEDHVVEEDELQDEVSEISIQATAVPREQFNEEAKRQSATKLVDRAATHLVNKETEKAFSDISHDKRFVEGELYVFVLDITKKNQAVCMAHGQENQLIWQDLYLLQDNFGVYFVREMVDRAKQVGNAGGWITYQWRNASKVSWIRTVKKGDKVYLLGAGYYPHSKVDAVVNMVKSAVALFNQLIAAGHPIDEAFSNFSYPIGRFVFGDLYLYALDFKGKHFAHGELPGLIGSNGWEYRDSMGKYVNQEIINKLKNKDLGVGIWERYMSKGAPKDTYAEKVVDKQGNFYFIACGYYPTAGRDQVVNLVRKGYQYMKQAGKTIAAKEFSEKRNLNFRYGDLTLAVHDMKGICIANGRDPEFVGENQFKLQDESGTFYIQEMIRLAKEEGRGWIDIKIRNSYQSIYFEKVDLGIEEFIISSGVFPAAKSETMVLLAKSGSDYLENNDLAQACREFIKRNGNFIRGDLELFVFDTGGICYVYGDDPDLIWRNLYNINDDDGKPFVKIFINTVKKGAGVVTYRLNGVLKTAHLEPVKKDGKLFIVGSSYYH